jgi:signal transduction histidine kinase
MYRRLSGRELLLIFVFWTSLAAVTSVNRLLDPRGFGLRPMSPTAPIALVFVESWIWAAFTPPLFRLSSFLAGKRRWLVAVPLLLVIGVVVSIAVYLLLDVVRDELFDLPTRRRPMTAFAPFREIGRFRFLNQLLVYCGVLTAGFAREFFLREQERGREAIALQAQLAEARLDALRMQLNPHFLFNTLHAVSALVERDPAGVRKMIARLSELLRHTIDARAADEVTLREELAFLRRYLDIMEIRFQGRLQVTMNVAPEALDALVPNLVLQPIVENALEHGVSRVEGDGRLELSARIADDDLVVAVCDNGPGLGETASRDGSGVGLANTRARLAQLYGDAGALTLVPGDGGRGVRAEIVVPFHTAGDLRASGRDA